MKGYSAYFCIKTSENFQIITRFNKHWLTELARRLQLALQG